MKDLFFVYIKIFLMIIIFYFILYKTVFSCLLKQESGFQNIYAILLTAIIMTCFELGFIWINYYYAFNNSASDIINNATKNIAIPVPKEGVDIVKGLVSGFATVDNMKVETLNTFATSAGILLITILILVIVIIDAKGKAKNFSTNPRVIFASIATAVSLAVFFGFFYFSTSSVYKMMPSDMDLIKSVKEVLENDIKAPEDINVRTVIPNQIGSVIKLIIILMFVIYIGNRFVFPKFQSLCKTTPVVELIPQLANTE